MFSSPMPRVTIAAPVLMAAVALCFTDGTGHQLGAQQTQSATMPTQQTERHGYGYGVASVVVPTASAPQPQVAAPAPQVVEQIDAPSLHLDQLMTLREWDATGVARLRPDERAALETWVQKYRSELLDSASHGTDAEPSTPAVASSGDVAPQSALQPPAPAAPAYVTPTPQGQPAYSPPGYAPTAQPTPPSFQPTYQPAPVAVPQPAAAPANPQGYMPPQAYAAYPQPAVAQAPVNPVPAPAVQYPTAPSGPAQAFQAQPLTPMMATPYAVTAAPAAPPAPAGAVVKTGLAVKIVQGSNRFVSLTDGSMWEVYATDRGEVGVWRADDPVYVRLATTSVSGGYDREIVNASRNVLVRVKFAGQLNAK